MHPNNHGHPQDDQVKHFGHPLEIKVIRIFFKNVVDHIGIKVT